MELILISGGCRSGKSRMAQNIAEKKIAPYFYVATCPNYDDNEMHQRIVKHRLDREKSGVWITIEEELDVAQAFENGDGTYVLDCMTLWLNNLMYHKKIESEFEVEELLLNVLNQAFKSKGCLIIVTNEVGCGIVPDNKDSRVFRDLVGRANQFIASKSDKVIFMSCGIPLEIKGKL